MSDLAQTVANLIAETIEESTGNEVEVKTDTALLTSGILDSLTVLQVFVALQEEFDIELDVDDLTEEAFGTPNAIAELVSERRES